MVREIWFENSGSRKVVEQKKRGFYSINLPLLWFKKSGWSEKKSEFAEPLFYNILEKLLEIKCSIEYSSFSGPDLVRIFLLKYNGWHGKKVSHKTHLFLQDSRDSNSIKMNYSWLSNKQTCLLISGKVCLLILIEAKRQTLPEISKHVLLLDDQE